MKPFFVPKLNLFVDKEEAKFLQSKGHTIFQEVIV